MDKAVAQDIGPWRNIGIAEKIESNKAQSGLIGQEVFDELKQVAEERIRATFEMSGSPKELCEIWNQIAMTMTEKCIRLTKKANRLEEENDGLRSKINSLEYLVREQKKKIKPDAQTIAQQLFDNHIEISHTHLLTELQGKGEFTLTEADHLIKQLMNEGYMYEFKSGFYKKA